jgi:hypothetical protein
MTSNGAPEPAGRPVSDAPARGRARVDLRRLRPVDGVVAAGTLLYLIFALAPWYTVDAFDLGFAYRFPAVSANGFDSGLIVIAFLLLLLAAGWALLPAVADVPLPVPRSTVTVGLSVLAVLLTVIELLSDLDNGFTAMGLLALVSAVLVLAAAVRGLVSELRGDPPRRGRSAADVT